MKRRELRAFSQQPVHEEEVENPFTSFKTTEVHITSELVPLPPERPSDTVCKSQAGNGIFQDRGYDRYTVTIASHPRVTRPTTPSGELLALRHHKVAMEANSAAWGYTKIAVLFFISLLITWVCQKIPYGLLLRHHSMLTARFKVPSSVNRVYSVVHPSYISVPFTFASAIVLPLMGFWNSVIYITTSWTACKSLIRGDPSPSKHDLRGRSRRKSEQRAEVENKRSEASVSDSMRRLAGENAV